MRDIADEPDWEEIPTLPQFRERRSGQFGVIVIQDRAGEQPIAQHRDCPFVSDDFFVEKVIDGAARTGRYYWAKNSRIAVEQHGAHRCEHPGDKLANG
jgi:hypothetical protein